MTDLCTQTSPGAIRRFDTLDGFPITIRAAGPDKGRVVVMFEQSPRETAAYDPVRQRLHVARLRTVVIPADRRLTPKSVVGILDNLDVPGALLVGDRAGASSRGGRPRPSADASAAWW